MLARITYAKECVKVRPSKDSAKASQFSNHVFRSTKSIINECKEERVAHAECTRERVQTRPKAEKHHCTNFNEIEELRLEE